MHILGTVIDENLIRKARFSLINFISRKESSRSWAMFILYRTYPDSFCASTETISDRASVHIKERLFRPNFCNGAKLRRGDL